MLIDKNPCEAIESAAWQNRKPEPLSLDEANRIVASLFERDDDQIGNFYEFMFFSGLRTGEGIGLEWKNVDWDKKI